MKRFSRFQKTYEGDEVKPKNKKIKKKVPSSFVCAIFLNLGKKKK